MPLSRFNLNMIKDLKISSSIFVKKNYRVFQDVYKVKKRLGKGAFGTVSLCHHTITGVKRAVKKIKKDISPTVN